MLTGKKLHLSRANLLASKHSITPKYHACLVELWRQSYKANLWELYEELPDFERAAKSIIPWNIPCNVILKNCS